MARAEAGPKRACCLISEMLEETGIDRETVRSLRRQVLEGVVALCRWQLERMESPASPPSQKKKARKVPLD